LRAELTKNALLQTVFLAILPDWADSKSVIIDHLFFSEWRQSSSSALW